MNKEYEYSFKVKDISKFLDYCISNNFVKKEEYYQIRTLYKNGGTIMARITETIYDDKVVKVLNFKEDNLSTKELKVTNETKDLVINDDNKEFVKSLIEILDLHDQKELKRKRYVYQKNNVRFEIDEYTKPVMKVVAIEGLKKEVDKVYQDLEKIIDEVRV